MFRWSLKVICIASWVCQAGSSGDKPAGFVHGKAIFRGIQESILARSAFELSRWRDGRCSMGFSSALLAV
jgi:hypothetical protein